MSSVGNFASTAIVFLSNNGDKNRGPSQLRAVYQHQLVLTSSEPSLTDCLQDIGCERSCYYNIISALTYLLAFDSRRSIGVFAWGDSGTLRLVKGQ